MCIPGVAGAEDPKRLCSIAEYCADNATCVDISLHPMMDAKCPYEIPRGETTLSFCGALHCYQHVCLPCLSGMRDIVDNKVCFENTWIFLGPQNPRAMILYHPTALLLLIIISILCFAFLTYFSIQITKYCWKQSHKKKQPVSQILDDSLVPSQ